jgi:hypothetical protein
MNIDLELVPENIRPDIEKLNQMIAGCFGLTVDIDDELNKYSKTNNIKNLIDIGSDIDKKILFCINNNIIALEFLCTIKKKLKDHKEVYDMIEKFYEPFVTEFETLLDSSKIWHNKILSDIKFYVLSQAFIIANENDT